MTFVHFFEGKTLVLSQLLNQIPNLDDNIKIKGRKGKVLGVNQVEENIVHIQIVFDKVVAKQALLKDTKKKKR